MQLVRVILVILLVVAAAVLSTPKGRLPLAVRGLAKILRKDQNPSLNSSDSTRNTHEATVPAWKRTLAFVLVLIAACLAMI